MAFAAGGDGAPAGDRAVPPTWAPTPAEGLSAEPRLGVDVAASVPSVADASDAVSADSVDMDKVPVVVASVAAAGDTGTLGRRGKGTCNSG